MSEILTQLMALDDFERGLLLLVLLGTSLFLLMVFGFFDHDGIDL